MTNRVAITGCGLVSPFGRGLPPFQRALLSGESALRPITRFPAGWCRHPVAGEVPEEGMDAQALGRAWLDASVTEALTQARWPLGAEPPLIVHTTVAGGQLGAGGYEGAGDAWLTDPVRPGGNRLSIAAACASAATALTVASDLLLAGQAGSALVMGVEVLNPFDWASLEVLRATSTTCPRPFDQHRDGVLLAEGAGALLVETAASLDRRGVTPLAWLDGAVATVGGYDMVRPELALMTEVMAAAIRLSSAPPDYVHAHATGTRSGDAAESLAIRQVVGGDRPVSSHKGALGHSLRISGFIGVAAALAAIEAQAAPPTVGLEEPDPDCPVYHIQGAALPTRIQRVLVNNFGFGGNYTSLILTRP
jgi:3-oxoacyl-[acyl-carrier-protein] synthase II